MVYDEFQKLAAQGYNRIPLMREVLADLDTPLSAYLKLADGPYSYLFESVQGGEKWGRYSIIGLPCRTVVRVSGHAISVEKDGAVIESVDADDPLAWIENFQARYKVAGKDAGVVGLPRFTGGMVGYFGYDTVRYIEPRLAVPAAHTKPDPIAAPDILLMVSDEVLVFDNLRGQSFVVSNTSVIQLPTVAPKYLRWLQSRATICREMNNMIHIGEHPNIVDLLEVLELIQDSKAVLFLVLEFVNGGELFDRMKRSSGPGTPSDDFARRYFSQLLSGIDYCHCKGQPLHKFESLQD